MEMLISLDENITDPLTMDQVGIVSAIFNCAEHFINNGHQVRIVKRYENYPDETKRIITELSELNTWKSDLNAARKKQGKALIN